MIRIQEDDFSVDAVVSALKTPEAGAIVTFTGCVRHTSGDGIPVEFLEWDVYETMAEKILRAIREEAIQTFQILDAAIVHRYGRQKPGENLVLIAVAGAHRHDAFAACEWIVDAIKKKVPLWKQEILANGEKRWIEG